LFLGEGIFSRPGVFNPKVLEKASFSQGRRKSGTVISTRKSANNVHETSGGILSEGGVALKSIGGLVYIKT